MLKGNTTRFRAIKNLGRRKIRRYLQQTDAGYGLYFSIDIVSRTNSIFRSSISAGLVLILSYGKGNVISCENNCLGSCKKHKACF